MNERERQQRFAENATISNSEYDRMNTNATRHSNPVMRGANLLPGERPTSGSSTILVLNVVGVIIAVALFGAFTVFAPVIIPPDIYNGTLFLFVALVLSVGIAYYSRFPLWRLWRRLRPR